MIEFTVLYPPTGDDRAEVPFKQKGILVDVGGVSLELFTVATLAKALWVTTPNIALYEETKGFPKPLYKVDGSERRLYSKHQILLARALVTWMRAEMRTAAIARGSRAKLLTPRIDWEEYARRLREGFYDPLAVLNSQTGRLIHKEVGP